MFLFARETAERLAASITEVPHARALEQVYRTVSLMTLQPVHHLSRSASELAAIRSARKRMHIIADFWARGKCDALDTHELGHAVQIRLWLSAQFVIHRDQYVLAAEQVEPRLEMRRVAIAAAEVRTRLKDFVERAMRPCEVNDQLVGGESVIDRIA